MHTSEFTAGSPGTIVSNLNGVISFLPRPLPPPLEWTPKLLTATHEATQAVSRLCGLGGRFPNPKRLMRLFLRREAEFSSRIEQTHASVRTMLFHENSKEAVPNIEVREVQNNYRVLLDGLASIEHRDVTVSLLKQLHRALFEGLPAHDDHAGRLRSIPVFIGQTKRIEEARFVPPPPLQVEGCMDALEAFVRASPASMPPIVRAALVHYQFGTIHPFNDGNGRIGRALIMMMLVKDRLLSVPLLNPSAGLERRRREYYDRLLNVSQRGEWAEWIVFFCECVTEEAGHSEEILTSLDALRVDFQKRLSNARANISALRLVDELFTEPVQTAASVEKVLGLASPTAANRALQYLADHGIVQEVTGRKRDRVFMATEIVDLFSDRPSTPPSAAGRRKRTRK